MVLLQKTNFYDLLDDIKYYKVTSLLENIILWMNLDYLFVIFIQFCPGTTYKFLVFIFCSVFKMGTKQYFYLFKLQLQKQNLYLSQLAKFVT